MLLVGLLGVVCWGLLRAPSQQSGEDVGFNVNIAPDDVAADLSKVERDDTLQWEIHSELTVWCFSCDCLLYLVCLAYFYL